MRLLLSAAVICSLSGVFGTAQSRAAGKLSGQVVDTSDNVMPGVSIGLRGPESRSAVTDKDGRFAFTSLTDGEYELWARLEGFATSVEKVAVTAKTEPVKIRMRVGRSAGQITGSVRGTAGVLLAGVYVEISSPDLAEKYRSTRTGSDGRYLFVDLPDGTYSVTFAFPGFWMQRRENVVLRNGSTAAVDSTMQVGGSNDQARGKRADSIAAAQSPIMHRSIQ